MVKTASRNFGEGSHGAVDAIAEPEPPRFKVIEALTDESRVVGQHSGGFAHDTVSLAKPVHARSETGYDAGKLVTEHDGVIDTPAVFSMVLVQIAAANADRVHAQENV